MDLKNFKFGMAFSVMRMNTADIGDYLNFQEFDAIELPWEILLAPNDEKAEKLKREVIQRKKKILFGGTMVLQLANEIMFAPEKLRKSFAIELEKSLLLLADLGFSDVTLECPLERIAGDTDAEKAFREIVLRVAPVLVNRKITMLVPVKFPCENVSGVMKLLRDTMIPNIKLRLDVYPWLLREKTDLRQEAGVLGFETCAVLFRYDADCGNRILKHHVAMWIDYLNRFGSQALLLLSPHSQRNRMAFPEATLYSGIINELQNS